MGRTILIVFLGFSGCLVCRIDAQYIHEILDYTPAPGQHINAAAGTPEAAQSILGTTTGLVSLGAFGGFITFRFEHPVANDPDHPYGIDFTIFGNSVGNWSEPGIVSVMNDENRNGLADDIWYELAGSEYQNDTCDRNYQVTYTNPGGENAKDVAWNDNHGNSGFVYANAIHTQPYYPSSAFFPAIDQSEYTLKGTRIYAGIDSSENTLINSPALPYGYADNHTRGSSPWTTPDNPDTPETEGAGGDPMDISWAVDSIGTPVYLDTIHFIKVHTAMNAHAGALGEISTEISGASIVDISSGSSEGNNVLLSSLQFRLYPNPAEDILFVEGSTPSRFRILNTAGQLIMEGSYSSGQEAFDLSSLTSGIYLIHFRSAYHAESNIFIKR